MNKPLPDDVVIEARLMAAEGTGRREIARLLSMSGAQVERAVRGDRYRHLNEVAPPVRGRATAPRPLTGEIVVEARRRAKDGESVRALAREFGVSDFGLHEAITGRTWSSVDAVESPKRWPVIRRHGGRLTREEIHAIHDSRDPVAALAERYRVIQRTVRLIQEDRDWDPYVRRHLRGRR